MTTDSPPTNPINPEQTMRYLRKGYMFYLFDFSKFVNANKVGPNQYVFRFKEMKPFLAINSDGSLTEIQPVHDWNFEKSELDQMGIKVNEE